MKKKDLKQQFREIFVKLLNSLDPNILFFGVCFVYMSLVNVQLAQAQPRRSPSASVSATNSNRRSSHRESLTISTTQTIVEAAPVQEITPEAQVVTISQRNTQSAPAQTTGENNSNLSLATIETPDSNLFIPLLNTNQDLPSIVNPLTIFPHWRQQNVINNTVNDNNNFEADANVIAGLPVDDPENAAVVAVGIQSITRDDAVRAAARAAAINRQAQESRANSTSRAEALFVSSAVSEEAPDSLRDRNSNVNQFFIPNIVQSYNIRQDTGRADFRSNINPSRRARAIVPDSIDLENSYQTAIQTVLNRQQANPGTETNASNFQLYQVHAFVQPDGNVVRFQVENPNWLEVQGFSWVRRSNNELIRSNPLPRIPLTNYLNDNEALILTEFRLHEQEFVNALIEENPDALNILRTLSIGDVLNYLTLVKRRNPIFGKKLKNILLAETKQKTNISTPSLYSQVRRWFRTNMLPIVGSSIAAIQSLLIYYQHHQIVTLRENLAIAQRNTNNLIKVQNQMQNIEVLPNLPHQRNNP